jgi:hypothetical protein
VKDGDVIWVPHSKVDESLRFNKLFLRLGLTNYLPGLALNCDPPALLQEITCVSHQCLAQKAICVLTLHESSS